MLPRCAVRFLLAIALASVGCMAEPTTPSGTPPLEAIWTRAIHAGDVVVLVPGTGAYDFLAATIEPLPGDAPIVDVRAHAKIADDAIVFEQAIAAAHRAGVSTDDLHVLLWGAGFTRLTHWTYVSYEGLHVPIEILGGENTCARGLVLENLIHYSRENLDRDARDLYARLGAWLVAHPSTGERDVIVASHSWGGAIAEYLAFERAAIAAKPGPLAAPVSLTIAMGVPGAIPNYTFAGPTFRSLDDGGGALYEVDRPDDPVHAMNPSGNPDGHQYDILFGDAFQGSYGITTDELSCRDRPGACD